MKLTFFKLILHAHNFDHLRLGHRCADFQISITYLDCSQARGIDVYEEVFEELREVIKAISFGFDEEIR
jgi:hypothetical protein